MSGMSICLLTLLPHACIRDTFGTLLLCTYVLYKTPTFTDPLPVTQVEFLELHDSGLG